MSENPLPFKLDVFEAGHDALSDEIRAGRVWEPAETEIVSEILERTPGLVLDFGAHVGWYTVMAGLWGHPVIAWEKDLAARRFLKGNVERYDLDVRIVGEVTDKSELMPHTDGNVDVALVKMDVEGEECNAVRMCRDLFYARRIAYALIEVSPIFTADGRSDCDYVTLVEHICASGYTARMTTMDGPIDAGDRRRIVAACGQENILFERAP